MARSEEKKVVVTDLLSLQAKEEEEGGLVEAVRKKVRVKFLTTQDFEILDLKQTQPALKRGRKPKTEEVKAKEEPEKKIPRKIPFDSSTSSEESVEMELASKVPPQASKTKNVSVSSEDEVMIKVVPPRRFDNKIIKENKGKNKEVKSNEGNEVPQTKKAKFSKVSDIFRPSPKPDMDLSRIDQKAPTRSKESSTPSRQVESLMKRKNAEIEKPVRLQEVDMFGSLEPTLKKMKNRYNE